MILPLPHHVDGSVPDWEHVILPLPHHVDGSVPDWDHVILPLPHAVDSSVPDWDHVILPLSHHVDGSVPDWDHVILPLPHHVDCSVPDWDHVILPLPHHVDGSVPDWDLATADALELLLSCTETWMSDHGMSISPLSLAWLLVYIQSFRPISASCWCQRAAVWHHVYPWPPPRDDLWPPGHSWHVTGPLPR